MNQSGKSRRQEPVGDEVGPLKHAPRTFGGLIDWSRVSIISWDFWRHARLMDCRNCSHYASRHFAGVCTDCKHECQLSIDFAKLEGMVIAANTATLEAK